MDYVIPEKHDRPDGEEGAARERKLTPRSYRIERAVQEQYLGVCIRWRAEAFRLLEEWWRTGNPLHMFAFVRHVAAMRRQIIGGGAQ